MTRPTLIIEDDPDIAEVLRYSLEARRFKTRLAVTGTEGLAASLDKDPPSLILLDLLLPEMSGLEVCRRIRKEASTAHIPIIMVTARASEADFISSQAAGADEYITKPFSIREVVERISALLTTSDNPFSRKETGSTDSPVPRVICHP